MTSQSKSIRCDFCGLEFDPDCTEAGCQGCPLARGCSRIVCPRCGYEMLPEAKLVTLIRQIRTRLQAVNYSRTTKISNK